MFSGFSVTLPEPLHDKLCHRAEQSGTSIRSLIIQAVEQTYSGSEKGTYLTGPLITGKGKLGPAFPVDENPHKLVFSWIGLGASKSDRPTGDAKSVKTGG